MFHCLAGQDGKTRVWSIDCCDLLRTIDYDKSDDEDIVTVPPVCLGEQWGNKGGMMGLGVGICDKLCIYY